MNYRVIFISVCLAFSLFLSPVLSPSLSLSLHSFLLLHSQCIQSSLSLSSSLRLSHFLFVCHATFSTLATTHCFPVNPTSSPSYTSPCQAPCLRCRCCCRCCFLCIKIFMTTGCRPPLPLCLCPPSWGCLPGWLRGLQSDFTLDVVAMRALWRHLAAHPAASVCVQCV